MSLSKKVIFSFIFAVWAMGSLFFAALPSLAESVIPSETGCQGYDPTDPYGVKCGSSTGLTEADPRILVGRIIRIALGLLGIIAVVIIIYAGFKWMTAGGNEENAKSAQKILMAGVIGLIIILSAYAISNFVLKELYKATQSAGSYPG